MLVRVSLGVAAVVLGFLGGVQVEQALVDHGPEPMARAIDPAAHRTCPVVPDAPPYPVNVSGMTYGSGSTDLDGGPDLVAARTADGRCGFVRATDRRSPGWVPLYDVDGVTVIGELHSGGS